MRASRFILSFLFMAAWLALLAHFRTFFHSSSLAVVSMAYLFLFITDRWDNWFHWLQRQDEFTKLDLNSRGNHG